jgi:hypothetical protein
MHAARAISTVRVQRTVIDRDFRTATCISPGGRRAAAALKRAIVVEDVANTMVNVSQLRLMQGPASVTTSAEQGSALHVRILTTLAIGAVWGRRAAVALQRPIVVEDVANTLRNIGELCILKVAVAILAGTKKCVTLHVTVLATLLK